MRTLTPRIPIFNYYTKHSLNLIPKKYSIYCIKKNMSLAAYYSNINDKEKYLIPQFPSQLSQSANDKGTRAEKKDLKIASRFFFCCQCARTNRMIFMTNSRRIHEFLLRFLAVRHRTQNAKGGKGRKQDEKERK